MNGGPAMAVASGSTAMVMARSSSTGASSGARQRRTPRIGMVDSPTQLSSATGSPAPAPTTTHARTFGAAPAELPYIRSPFRPFGLFTALANVLAPVPDAEPPTADLASPRTLYRALDEHTAAAAPEQGPSIRLVPPRRATEATASDMSRGTSSSSSVYSSSSDLSMARLDSLTSFETSSSKAPASGSDRSASRGSSVTLSPHSSTHSSWLKLIGKVPDGDRLTSRSASLATLRHQKALPSRSSSGWTSLPPASPRLARGTPTWPLSPSPLRQEVGQRAPRWTAYKWWLLFSTFTVLSYGLAGFICSLLTWFRTWALSDVVVVTDTDILAYTTLASSLCLVTALIGVVGTMLNSKPILTVYNVLMWPTFVCVLLVGSSAYRRHNLQLDRKLNEAWSQAYSDRARLRIQNNLNCCGYYNTLHDATFSKRCYPRSMLPGCKQPLLDFQNDMLSRFYTVAFGIAPLHLLNMFVAILCANHVVKRWGKGLTPRAYRLTPADIDARPIHIEKLRSVPGTVHRSVVRRDSVSTLQTMPTPANGRLRGLGLLQGGGNGYQQAAG